MSIEFNVYRLVNESLKFLDPFYCNCCVVLKNTNKEVGRQDSVSIENCPPSTKNTIHHHSLFFCIVLVKLHYKRPL